MTPPVPSGYRLVRHLLFRLDPERAHRYALAALAGWGRLRPAAPPATRDRRLAQRIWGRDFPNPLGLAAGFDKDAVALRGLTGLGFGFVEVGTVTPRAQAGNAPPRLFRHQDARALRNAMGFNNAGMDALRARLAATGRLPIPLGVNIGKNRDTPIDRALDDYAALLAAFSGRCDYFVVNVSSPNTPGLRGLQNEPFLGRVLAAARGLAEPALIKLSPDLPEAAAVRLAAFAVERGAAGVVIANTTTDYAGVPGAGPPGGLSGAPLAPRARALLAAVARELRGHGLLISAGGIETGDEAYRRLRLGASLLQVYTALVYRGPALPRLLAAELAAALERDGVGAVTQIVGADVR